MINYFALEFNFFDCYFSKKTENKKILYDMPTCTVTSVRKKWISIFES